MEKQILKWEEHRILIWGKTYPELSSKYLETVCTGGTLEDGRYVRIYPIPFRYLNDGQAFSKYQWVRAKIKKSSEDPRPESNKIDIASIKPEDIIPPDKFEWQNRAEILFKNKNYFFPNVEELISKNRSDNLSMGFVRPLSIEKIEVEKRPIEDYASFKAKIEKNKEKLNQTDIFSVNEKIFKELTFVSDRFKIKWKCNNPDCKGHSMSILDWEVYELARRHGVDRALDKLKVILDLEKYDIGFFLGNFRLYPNTFAIGSIWYPKKNKNLENYKLF